MLMKEQENLCFLVYIWEIIKGRVVNNIAVLLGNNKSKIISSTVSLF